MTNRSLVFAIAVAFCLMGAAAFAHPPKKITAQLEVATGRMDLEVAHSVGNVNRHRIGRIRVFVNDESAIDKKYESQTNQKEQIDAVVLKPLKAGDKVRIKASCNIFGSKTLEFVVGDQAKQTEPPPETDPAATATPKPTPVTK